MEITKHPSGCKSYWDGVDFSQCFHDRYLRNAPLGIVILALTYFLITHLKRYFSPPLHDSVRSENLVSPTSDSDLSKLESDVILSALASSILPRPSTSEKGANKGISSDEAEDIIEYFKKYDNVSSERWEKVGWVVGIFGGLVLLGVSVVRAILEKDWRAVPFPALIAVLSFSPRGKVIPLLTIHLIPSLFLFRSSLIHHAATPISIFTLVAQLVYFFALICIPYQDPLDRLLGGAHSKGGGNSGSDVPLPKHYEEPISVLSRATYVFIIPFLVKHYFSAIKLEEVPAIREDDSSSAGLGAFRAFRARKDAAWSTKHLGEKRKRNLAWDLLQFFSPEMLVQTMWSIIFIFIQYLAPNGLRLLLQYVNERDTNERPVHVAYLYVAMMAGGQVMGITAMGQCLFIGRRVCIRLRAIIIAEVFTKALRRRDVAGSVKNSKPKFDVDGKPLPQESQGEGETGASDGKIANHVSVDAFAISEICAYIFYIVSSPLAIVVNSFFLYQNLGVAAFAGIAILVLMIPIQGAQSRLYTNVQKKFMAATDARLDAVTEIISHVKLIKFNAWETKFFDRMAEKRKHELRMLAHRFGVNVMFQVVIWGTPLLVTACAFAVHVLVLKKPLRADTAFSSLILFNMLRDPLGLFQDTLTRLLQAYTSCTRIQAFLDEPDTEKYAQLTRPGPNDPQIGFSGAMVGYSSAADIKEAEFEPFQLGPLDLSFPVGQLSVIIGSVGSGKTTLIQSLLGETTLLEGKIYMPGDHANREICPIEPITGLSDTVAYCAQSAWLVGASIKDNIVFGSAWDKARYNAVVAACALKKDFEIFDLGDDTEVGEKGTTCSGGQKARIALARALYSPAGTILLDDVLSAVDAQTARHLHLHCLLGPLMNNRTVILVTHQVNLVAPSAAYVVSLQDGQVVAAGSPSNLVSSGDLELTEDELDRSSTPTSSTLAANSDEPVDIIEENLDGIEHDALDTKKHVDADEAAPEAIKLAKQLVATELQGQGVIKLETYMLYFKSMGSLFFWVILGVAFGGAQLLQIASNAWIKDWANANDPSVHRRHQESMVTMDTQEMTMRTYLLTRSTQFYLGVYVGITFVFLIGVAARFGIGYYGSLRASSRLYDKLLKRILGAKMRFFDSTPSGRIINRFSKDMSSIDTEAGEILLYFLQTILAVAASLGVVIFSTPAFILPLVAIAVVYWFIGLLYVTTSRELKRMDSTTRSPLFISFSEALVGMSTIRSYGDSARFMRKIFRELDQNTRCFWYLWQTNRVLHNFSNFTGSLVTIFACVFALRNKEMSAGAVGFSISYALSFTEYVLWIVRMYAAAEMSMNSVERVSEYLDLDVEEEEQQRGFEPPAHWPSRDSKVEVENLTCHYAPQLEPVLRGVSFEIGPKEKIGICGRTGSGKSTLALSFFRFLHQSGGTIRIDGLDISKISLSTLRSRLTILPQEAQLFSGSVRENLDPFNSHEDAEIWEALRQCGLASSGRTPTASGVPSRVGSKVGLSGSIKASRKDLKSLGSKAQLKGSPLRRGLHDSSSEDGTEVDEGEAEERVTIRSLDEKVAVGGKNFSQGQRQLLALARGLLKLHNSSFLIMDESTANLDHATDQTIQNVLRTGLKDTQMLVIAHRLLTVVELDKILVLDHGEVVEFGTPWELIQKDGMFRDLCRQSGEDAQLMEMAKLANARKRQE